MSDVAIRVENLGKMYHIGQRESYRALRDTLADAMQAPFRAAGGLLKGKESANGAAKKERDTIFWALKDVSFEIKQGEVVGIIGRNGAGKSTLLKILSRITEPTEGSADLNGRVRALLEVGTGFHPELTGRENIYLNGSILGMKRAEIKRRFDEIVAFAEIEKFIDTPVKRYSSGMYVRLAFAVAAHLEPEILIIDEVLAVGDAAFQKKCLGKIGDVAKEGRTVLFVSHNLGSMANLCTKGILLVHGGKQGEGEWNRVVSQYVSMVGSNGAQGETVWHNPETAPGNENARLHAVRIVSGGRITNDVDIQEDINIEIEFWNLKPDAYICSSFHLVDKTGVPVLASLNVHSANLLKDEWFGKPHPVGLYKAVCTIPGNLLNESVYSVNAFVLTDITHVEAVAGEAVSFSVHETGAMRKEFGGTWIGLVRPKLAWQTEYLGASNGVAVQEKH